MVALWLLKATHEITAASKALLTHQARVMTRLESFAHAESLGNMESQAESSLAQPSDNEVETATSLSSCFGRICLVRLSCSVVPRRNTSVRLPQFLG